MGKDVQTAISFTNYASFFSNASNLFLLLLTIPAVEAGAFALLGMEPRSAFILSYLVLLLPCLVFIAMWHLLARRKYLLSHGIVLSIAASAIMAVSMLLSFLLTGNPLVRDTLLFAIPFILIITFYIGNVLSNNMKHALLMSIILGSFFGISFLVRANIDYKTLSYELLGASAFVLFVAWATLQVINAPLKKRYEISITEVMSSLLGGWFYEGEEFESVLERIGKTIETYVGVIEIENREGTLKVVVPYFHFGPFGNIGASRFPAMLRKKMPHTMVLHGTATHDLNLTSKKEAKKVISEISKESEKRFSSKFCYVEGKAGTAIAQGLCFGNDVLCLVSRAPEVTEDIELAGGLILIERLRRDFKEAIVADCHNSSAKKITYFTPTSDEFKEYYDAVSALRKCEGKEFKAGFAFADLESDQVDEGGTSVLALEGKEKVLVVSVDANGISAGTKKAIEDIGSSLGYKTIVCSTDSHGKNVVKGIVNEFRMSPSDKKKVEEIIKAAVESRSNAKARVEMRRVRVKVLGDRQVGEIMATLNSTWAVMKWVIPAALVLSAAGLVLLF